MQCETFVRYLLHAALLSSASIFDRRLSTIHTLFVRFLPPEFDPGANDVEEFE